MKKFLMIALLVGAIPAVAFSQNVSCEGCSHYVSVYQGEGGFIATADGDMVTFVATCEGVTRSGELTPNDDGVVSMLLTGDYACSGDNEKNAFMLGPIMDGGWYWITEDDNSAVGNLVGMDILDNEPTMITETSSVTMTDGKGAKLLKETASGRVGILPTILPVPEMEPVKPVTCGYNPGTTATRKITSCMLGDGGTEIRALGPINPATAKRDPIPNMGTVQRPAAGSYEVSFDLWGNGTGHYTTAATGTDAKLGHAGGTELTATISGVYGGAVGVTPPEIDSNEPSAGGTNSADTVGLRLAADSTNGNISHLTIYPNSNYCSATESHDLTVTIRAVVTAANTTQVTPTIKTTAGPPADLAATMTLTVVCPAASANMGQELVPENPFPTTE